jgi:hypothetical protein
MWSCWRERFDWRKEECGLTFRRCFERRYEDSCRLDEALSASRHCDLPERRLAIGLLITLASIAGEECTESELKLSLAVSIFSKTR